MILTELQKRVTTAVILLPVLIFTIIFNQSSFQFTFIISFIFFIH